MKLIEICEYEGQSLFSDEGATIFCYWYETYHGELEFRCDPYKEAKNRMFIPGVSANPPKKVLRSVAFWRAIKNHISENREDAEEILLPKDHEQSIRALLGGNTYGG